MHNHLKIIPSDISFARTHRPPQSSYGHKLTQKKILLAKCLGAHTHTKRGGAKSTTPNEWTQIDQ